MSSLIDQEIARHVCFRIIRFSDDQVQASIDHHPTPGAGSCFVKSARTLHLELGLPCSWIGVAARRECIGHVLDRVKERIDDRSNLERLLLGHDGLFLFNR